MSKPALLCALFAATCGTLGCDPSQHKVDDDAGTPQTEDASSPATAVDASEVDASKVDCTKPPEPVTKVDLLFIVDNSGSMEEEQANLAKELPRLVRALSSGDLENGGSKQDFAPVTSLHLGVVSSDMGTDDVYPGPVCTGNGDDGLLLDAKTGAGGEACASDAFGGKPYFEYVPGEESMSPADAAAKFGCVAALGINGCGLEQQLEAMHKALQPSSVTDFVSGKGHGDQANAGFLRKDAVLAVVHVSDEEDCSITKKGRGLFDHDSEDPRFLYDGKPSNLQGEREGLNFRCAYEATQDESAEMFQPIDRFVDGLLKLKPSHPERLVYAAVVGVPQAAEDILVGGDESRQDFKAILALREMQIRPGLKWCNPGEEAEDNGETCGKPAVNSQVAPPLPQPACTGPGGSGSPGRRFVQVANQLAKHGLGANAMVRSICSDDFANVAQNLVGKIAKSLEAESPDCE